MPAYNPPNWQGNPAAAIPVAVVAGMGSFPPVPGAVLLGTEQIALGDGAVHAPTVPTGATSMVVYPEAGNARWAYNANPTASVGMPIWATGNTTFAGSSVFDLTKLNFIRLGGTGSPILNIAYFG